MASYDVRIRLGDSSSAGVDPAKLVLKHHLADRAEVHAEALSGGHLLHLSVAGCLFNAILREARSRGIAVTDLQISAEGDFGGEPSTSTRITYSVDLAGEAPEDELRKLVAECEELVPIPLTLERGARIQAGAIGIRSEA
ncbi:MAG TPA: OsmC family protein [Thermoleophilaceae bacterium]|nr:OsmC family protein [Thermoleophilaceae bacterium]